MAELSLGRRMKALRGEVRREAISKIVAEYESSGSSARAFCESKGIARVTLTRWRREARGSRVRKRSRPRFLEVHAAASARASHFEVTLSGGVSVRVPAGFDESDLGRLMAVLRATC